MGMDKSNQGVVKRSMGINTMNNRIEGKCGGYRPFSIICFHFWGVVNEQPDIV